MSTRQVVDVIVIGGRIGPLTAACLLSRRGYKVVHVEHEGLASAYPDEDFRLPLEPDLLPGPKSSPAIAHVLKALALATDAQRLLRPISPSLQILSPGHRFELMAEPARRARELEREFGKSEAASLTRALDGLLGADQALDPLFAAMPPLPPDGLLERRAVRKAASGLALDETPDGLPPGHPLGAAIGGLSRLSSYLWSPAASGLHSVRSTARLLRGVHRLGDGETSAGGGYGALLRRRLTELGGVSLGGGEAVAEQILVEGGRVAGLKVLGDPADYRCRYMVVGLDTAALHRLLPLEGRRRRYDSTLDSVRPRDVLFSLNVVLDRRGLPLGLGEAGIYIADPNAEASEENLLLLERFDAVGTSGRMDDKVVIQASCFMPASRRELGDDYLDGLRERILDVLRADLLPFLDQHLILASSPMLTRKGPARGARLMPHPHFESDLDLHLGVGLLSPRTPYKNLVLAGREVLPGLGVEGEFFTGHRATEVVAHAARRHDPLKDQ